jgi:hypothetical protein
MSQLKKVAAVAPMLITPAEAGLLLGQAVQTTRNQISNPKIAGAYPLPLVVVGKRKMVRVTDLENYVAGLMPVKHIARGAPTKAERMMRAGGHHE